MIQIIKIKLPNYIKFLLLEWGIEFVLLYILMFSSAVLLVGLPGKFSDYPVSDYLVVALLLIPFFLTRILFLQIPISLFLRMRYAKRNSYRLKNALLIISITYAISYSILIGFVALTDINEVKRFIPISAQPFVAAILAPIFIYRWKGDLFEMAWANSRKMRRQNA
ncbi:hypothetical protein [Curvivirga sp.]|uniref:hypothetical protein n=1 Tax=Curvivirga sp. TaxID=2856848 RepID=UPI003B5A0A38